MNLRIRHPASAILHSPIRSSSQPSASCLVARRVAEAHPERVARLVLLGAPQSLGDNQEELELQTAVRALQDPVPVRFARELRRITTPTLREA
jgi:pimeloyl-ACP methyl ester carboxylesterase